MRKANIIGALIFLAFSIYVIAVTFTFKQFKTVPVGPEFFPRYLGIGLFICSLVLLVQSVKSKSTEKAPTLSLKDPGMQRLLMGLVLIILYVALWTKVGFLIVTPIMLFLLMYLLKIRKYVTMVVLALGMSVGIFLIFKLILGIEMPLGILEGIINF